MPARDRRANKFYSLASSPTDANTSSFSLATQNVSRMSTWSNLSPIVSFLTSLIFVYASSFCHIGLAARLRFDDVTTVVFGSLLVGVWSRDNPAEL